MKPLKPRTAFCICAVLVLVGLSALSCARKENTGHIKIQGTVVDITPDISQESLAKLDKAGERNSEKEFIQILKGMYEAPSPVPNAFVTATGDSVTKKANTDSEGKFKFTGLPDGAYELSAEVSPEASEMGEKRMTTTKPKVVTLFGTNPAATVMLSVRGDLVTVRGRITDVQGRPIAGAKVRGEPYPMPESAEATPPTRFAVSGSDGSYELSGFVPNDISKIGGYLGGGDPTEFGQNPFYVKVHVEADGYVQDKTSVPRVPLVTEELLEPARRLLKILSKLQTRSDGSSKFHEKKDILLPSSHGNVITHIDIVLK